MGEHTTQPDPQASYPTCFAAVTEPFSFYATGDDDTTRSYDVQVQDRPRIEDIRVTVRAPDYTGEPERVQADGRGAITGLAGSAVALEIATNKPIARTPDSALLRVNGQPHSPMAFLGEDPTRLRGAFTLQPEQKEYAIALTDTDGLTNSPPATYRLDVRPDREPAVKLPEPGASKKVTPRAIVPIRLTADDDFRVCRTRFLHQRDEKAKPVPHPFPDPPEPVKKVEQSTEWDLTALALKERDVLRVYAEAEDNCVQLRDGKPSPPHVGRSPVYLLTVISEAEMASLLQRQQQELKEQIKKLIGRQDAAKATVDALQKAEKPDRHQVTVAEREERKLVASAESIATELEKVLGDMKNNKVGTPVDHRRARDLGQAVRKAAATDMPDAAKQISKAAQATEPPEQRQLLATAAARQQQIADDLRAALAKFEQWHDLDELLRDASELLLTQKKLNENTADMARKLLGKAADQLTPAEKGSARSLARAQQGARDAMQALETKMAEVAQKIRDKEPAAAKLVDQALSQASADQIRKRMDDAATRVDQARPASALPLQAEATTGLEKLVEALSRARSPNLVSDFQRLQEQIRQNMDAVERLLKDQKRQLSETQIGNLRRQLADLRKQQAATQAATQKASSPADLKSQAAPQATHAAQAEELGRQLERLTEMAKEHKEPLAKAAQAVKAGTEQMTQAKGAVEQGQQDQATKAQGAAIQQLDKAEQQLAELESKLAQGKPKSDRLGERAAEQDKTAKATSQASENIQKTGENAQKTLPSTAKALQQAGEQAKDAAGSMNDAKEQLEQGARQPDAGPSQQEKAEQDQQKAADKLQKTLDQLAKAHEQLDLQRRTQQLFELQKLLTEMLPRQVAIREATEKLDAATEGGQKPLDHAQTLKLRELTDQQGKLHEESGQIIERLEREKVPVFLYVMRDAARLMAEAHKRLGEQKTDWLTQESQREVERDLAQLLEALKSESQRLAQQEQKGGGGGQGGANRPQPLVPPLAQLKQLHAMQGQINTETKTVEIERATAGRARERLLKHRATRLSERQNELGKISRDFGDALEKENQKESLSPP
jgi:hypothetical protein